MTPEQTFVDAALRSWRSNMDRVGKLFGSLTPEELEPQVAPTRNRLIYSAQAGLNWSLVLKKRHGYRRAFDNFDPEKVARYSENQIQTLSADPNIIRNRMKIEAAVRNARAFLKIQEEFKDLTPTAGVLSAGGPSSTNGRQSGRFLRVRPNPTLSARTSSTGDSASSARRSSMRTCRRMEW